MSKYILTLISIVFFITTSCNKKEKINTEDLAKKDNTEILAYLNTHSIKTVVNNSETHIDWEIVKATETDETLFAKAVVDSISIQGLMAYYYFINIEEGGDTTTGIASKYVISDFNERTLNGKLISSSVEKETADKLALLNLTKGLRDGLKYFFAGIKPTGFELDYRNKIEKPGRGVLVIPSMLAYGEDGNSIGGVEPYESIVVDMVVYEKSN